MEDSGEEKPFITTVYEQAMKSKITQKQKQPNNYFKVQDIPLQNGKVHFSVYYYGHSSNNLNKKEYVQNNIDASTIKLIKQIDLNEQFEKLKPKIIQMQNKSDYPDLKDDERKFVQQNYSFKQFLQERKINKRICRRIMRDVARKILVFQVYFDDLLYKRQKQGKLEELQVTVSEQLLFLRQAFYNQNKHIKYLFKDQINYILNKLVVMRQFPNIHAIIDKWNDISEIEQNQQIVLKKEEDPQIQFFTKKIKQEEYQL